MAELSYWDPTGKGYPHGKFEDYYKEINEEIITKDYKNDLSSFDHYRVLFVPGKDVKYWGGDSEGWAEDTLGKYAFLDFDPDKYYKIWIRNGRCFRSIELIEPYDGPIYRKDKGFFEIEDMEDHDNLIRMIIEIKKKLHELIKNIKKPNLYNPN